MAVDRRLRGRLMVTGWIVSAVVMRVAYQEWKGRLHEMEERAADAERTQEETARRRAVEERLRIARELHDSLTHSISVIKVQAGVAVHLARKRGEQVPEALLAIQEASRDAIRELRATLVVLRQDDEAATSGLDRLDDLIERARSAGLPTTVRIEGSQRPLPPEVDRAAYRIIQEALTNTTRHAGPASASVQVTYGMNSLIVQVDDDGRGTGSGAPAPGLGLIGMRERVSALGGQLRTEPGEVCGFTVRAELPAGAAS